jgi:hypothetical protein
MDSKLIFAFTCFTFHAGIIGLGVLFYLENNKTNNRIQAVLSDYDKNIQRNILYLENNIYNLTTDMHCLKKTVTKQDMDTQTNPVEMETRFTTEMFTQTNPVEMETRFTTEMFTQTNPVEMETRFTTEMSKQTPMLITEITGYADDWVMY